jgi:hypothetical protein
VKSLIISFAVFLLLCGTVAFFTFGYLSDRGPREMMDELYTGGKLLLFRHGMIEKLSSGEMTRLYHSTCTRKCHSRDVIEKKPRTAMEWEWIVSRMQAPDRAGIADHHAEAITRYLQEHFLSNVPTIMPEKTMRFVRRHLWKSDFGESDLYLDIIYMPSLHLSLLPYLIASTSPPQHEGAVFIIYINTHQGTIPPWNLMGMARLQDGDGLSLKATGWTVIYEDGQGHHKQGILTFPMIDDSKSTAMEVAVQLPGMRKRIYQWKLPIPRFEGEDDGER